MHKLSLRGAQEARRGNPKKIGFTLAEVLITLSIIGVVAALTIPSVTRKFEKQQYIAQYKETFSILSQAAKTLQADNGGSLNGLWTSYSGMYDTFLPYFKTVKSCRNNGEACFATNTSYKMLDNSAFTANGTGYCVTLSNGASVGFRTGDIFTVDFNGPKGPNVIGKDYHEIYLITNTGELKPLMYNYSDNEAYLDSRCPDDLKTGCSGWCGGSCGFKILRGDYASNY